LSIKVAVVDDQDIIWLAVQQSLADRPLFTFLGGYATLKSFLAAPACQTADVVLLDDSLRHIDTLQAIKTLRERCPQAAILLLGAAYTSQSIHAALAAGAGGMICKKERVMDLLAAGIRLVYDGEVYLSPKAAITAGRVGHVPALSSRLYEVLRLIVRSHTMPEIALALGISRRAVYSRRDRLKDILGVDTNEQIVAEAIRRGYIGEQDE
jgi:DNA-binding NarL/FixJ family response regulator